MGDGKVGFAVLCIGFFRRTLFAVDIGRMGWDGM